MTTPGAHSLATRVRDEAMRALSFPPDIWDMRCRMEEVVKARVAVWAWMRDWRNGPMRLSYPEIAAATNGASHSTVVTALEGVRAKAEIAQPHRYRRDFDTLDALREHWLLFAAFEEPEALDRILELLDADAADSDSGYVSPSVMGSKSLARTAAAEKGER